MSLFIARYYNDMKVVLKIDGKSRILVCRDVAPASYHYSFRCIFNFGEEL
jgi:hypothetical protein